MSLRDINSIDDLWWWVQDMQESVNDSMKENKRMLTEGEITEDEYEIQNDILNREGSAYLSCFLQVNKLKRKIG